MSLLVDCGPSRWIDFLNIKDDQVPTAIGEEHDFFVGKNKSITWTLKNGTTTKIRDMVLYGDLIVQSSNPEDHESQPKLICRDCMVQGKLTIQNIEFTNKNQIIFGNVNGPEGFRNKLLFMLIEWFEFQRESVRKSGLKSILVDESHAQRNIKGISP